MYGKNGNGRDVVRLVGAFMALFSAAFGLLLMFVIPSACSFVTGLGLLLMGFLFTAGILVFLFGTIVLRRRTG